ncbi:MAG: hypothetical protein HF978_08785 [Desulfobacteraceae bacterium]|nr:hypothetical protein [Desulfobacteraceae bacterium]MBC2755628.1 hypothetical protein [Desulfobacteraceae bacterium]
MALNPTGYAYGSEFPLHCQAMGMSMTLEEDDVNVDGDDYHFYLFGAAAQRPYHKNRLEYGIEGGLMFSMENDTRLVEISSGPDGGTIKVEFENQMLLIDYFGGGYVGFCLTKRLRLYAGAGPLIVYGRRAFDPEKNEDESIKSEVESKLSAGFYGRTGIEFKITDNFMLGAGIRALTSGLKFKEPAGKIQYEGIQYVFSISYEITSF